MNQPASPLAEPTAWNLVTDGYVSENVPHFTLYATDVVRMAGIGAGSKVGDIACGPGTLSFVAANAGAEVLALDFAEHMIAHLHERVAREQQTRITATVGDGQHLPWPDGQLDATFSMFGLMFFPDRASGFREMHRVLKPGGRTYVTSWVPLDRAPVIAALFESIQEALPGMPFSAGKAPLGELAELETELTQSGFRDVRTQTLTHVLHVESLETFWQSVLKSLAPLVLMRHRMGEAFAPFAAKVFANLKTHLPSGPVHVEMTANLGSGAKP